MRLRSILLGTIASTIALGAESPEYSLVAYYYTDLKEVDLQALQSTAGGLGFESDEAVLGFEVDLNGDSIPEHVLRGSCGNSACSLRVIDGKTKALIASLMGRPLIVHSARINNWPVLSTYHRFGATDGILSTSVFDGQRYQQISSIALYEQAIADLFEKKLKSVPSIGRPR